MAKKDTTQQPANFNFADTMLSRSESAAADASRRATKPKPE
jgi:hypothetical protein